MRGIIKNNVHYVQIVSGHSILLPSPTTSISHGILSRHSQKQRPLHRDIIPICNFGRVPRKKAAFRSLFTDLHDIIRIPASNPCEKEQELLRALHDQDSLLMARIIHQMFL